MRLVYLLLIVFVLGSCGDDDNPDGGMTDTGPDASSLSRGCNPIGESNDCVMPFPSDYFLVDDASSTTGKKVSIPETAQVTWDQESYDPTANFSADGFSISSQIVFALDDGVEETQLVNRRDDFRQTLETSSPTLLIEAETGELVPHFAEIDARDDSANPLTFIRPATPLGYETRYIVAVHGTKNLGGSIIDPTAGFRALRDAEEQADASLLAHYESDIFPLIESAGVAREELQLAWDFTTGSEQSVKERMFEMRDAMRTWLEDNDPPVTITSVRNHESADLATQVLGTIGVPAFVDSAAPGARLLDTPNFDSLIQVPFKANIPQRVVDNEVEGRALQFGHGFFGDYDEIDSDFHASFANEYGFVHFAIDWWGMSEADQGPIVSVIMNNMDDVPLFAERVHQAMANQLAFTRAIKTSLAASEAFRDGESVLYETDNVYYYGISGGHMLGSVFLALSDEITRAALSVGGGSWTLIASRSTNFGPFLAVIALEARTSRKVQQITAQFQLQLDTIDPISYAGDLRARMEGQDPLVLSIQAGLGDAQVPNIATEQHVRALKIPALAPVDWEYFGRETVQSPAPASAVTWFDFGTDPLPGDRATTGTENTPAHSGTRKTTASQEQLDRLFRPGGQIEHTCDGVCDPE